MKPLVENTGDAKQVARAGEREKLRRRQELDDIRHVLDCPQGRRFLWRLMSHCQMFRSISVLSAEIHQLSGRRDVGLFVLGEATEARKDAYLLMQSENEKEIAKNV